MDELKEAIRVFVVAEYVQDPTQVIADDTPLISSGVVDSFSMVSLKRFLERTYHLAIPDQLATVDAFDSVDRIAALVRRLRPDA